MPIVDLTTARWRKSTRSTDNADCVEVAFEGLTWRKSTRSSSNAACVEVAFPGRAVAVRDSKAPSSGALVLSAPAWRALLTARACH